MLFELDRQEYDVVTDVLRRAMGDLREEIYKTDLAELDEQLKQREAALAAVLQRLEFAEASGLVEGEPTSRH
jgi:hypothetical protein